MTDLTDDKLSLRFTAKTLRGWTEWDARLKPDQALQAILISADRLDKAADEIDQLRALLEARDAYDRGEPSRPPVTGRKKTALQETDR